MKLIMGNPYSQTERSSYLCWCAEGAPVYTYTGRRFLFDNPSIIETPFEWTVKIFME
jgi:hypothetical protein